MLPKASQVQTTGDKGVDHLKMEVAYRTRLQEIGNKINAASDLDAIFIDLKNDILSLFDAQRLTIYVVDDVKGELVSRFKSGDEVAEIRLPVNKRSLAGYSALTHKLLTIANVYDASELRRIDKSLSFDKRWDQKTGYRTRQALVYPIIFQNYLMGILQLINRKAGSRFTPQDEKSVADVAKIIGIAIYNQKRIATRIGRGNKFDYILENHLLTEKEIARAISDAQRRKETVEAVLLKDYKIPKAQLGESLSRYYKVPFIAYNADHPIPGKLLAGLKASFMRNSVWVPVGTEEDQPLVAIDDPRDLKRIDEIKSLFSGRSLKFVVALRQDILDLIELFTRNEKKVAEIDDILSLLEDESDEIEEIESSLDEEDSAVVQLVDKIILDAHARGASDIHIEPDAAKQNTTVRIRVDGACAVYQTIPFAYRNAVVSRIKIMSDLDIAERRLPQDGKIIFKKYSAKEIELRVATIPTQGGVEDVVMRILTAGEPMALANMEFSKRNYESFVKAVVCPYGLVLVCGPTGSGKTTTLHSALSYINKTETKIWTAEDPVEITQKGLRQVQVKPKIGFDFAAAMRSFLRADPDVIMVGEMRDKETTHIGIEASLTGHLVFSTLHTNSAPECITRLLDMGMDPFNFADAILCIMAQRLVRTLCSECKQAYNPSKQEYDELVREYGDENFEARTDISYANDLTLQKPVGCDSCNGTGYRGRMGIHELLVGTDPMKRLIQNRAHMKAIRQQAISDGMSTLKQDGIEKIFAGHTDLLQVRKVCIK